LWNPHIFSGFPAVADPQIGLFYPPNFLLCLFSTGAPLSYKLFEAQLVFHYFLTGLFTYVFLRSLNLLPFAAVVGGIAFMFSGFYASQAPYQSLVMAVPWIPLIFYYTRRSFLQNSYQEAIKAGALLGVQILAGHPQTSVYTLVAVAFYFLWEATMRYCEFKSPHLLIRYFLRLLLLTMVGVGIAAVQILPTLQLTPLSLRSVRVPDELESVCLESIKPVQLITLAIPNFFGGLLRTPMWHLWEWNGDYYYMGVLPLILVLIGLRFISREMVVWIAEACLFLLLALSDYLYWPRLFFYLAPQLNLFVRNLGFFLITDFCLAILAGYGMHLVWNSETRGGTGPFICQRLTRAGAGLFALAVVFLALLTVVPKESETGLNCALTSYLLFVLLFFLNLALLLMVIWHKLDSSILQTLILVLLVLDVFSFNSHQRFNFIGFDPGTYLSPDSLSGPAIPTFLKSDPKQDYRVAPLSTGQWDNGGSVVGYQSIFGYTPIALKSYCRYVSHFAATFDRRPMFDKPPNLNSRLLDLLSVKYVTVEAPLLRKRNIQFSSDKYDLRYDDGWFRVYYNKTFLPRAFVSTKALVLDDPELTISFLESPVFEARKTIVVDFKDAQDIPREMTGSSLWSWVEAERFETRSEIGGVAKVSAAMGGECLGLGWNFASYLVTVPNNLAETVIGLRYSSAGSGNTLVDLSLDQESKPRATAELPPTGGWGFHTGDWRFAVISIGSLNQGTHKLRFCVKNNVPVNFDGFSVQERGLKSDKSQQQAIIVDSGCNDIKIQVEMITPGFLVLTDTYYPGWTAYCDGQRKKILRANGISRAVYLETGRHQVEFKFRPKPLYWGFLITFLTGAFVLAVQISPN
jgi:hypothetical protein